MDGTTWAPKDRPTRTTITPKPDPETETADKPAKSPTKRSAKTARNRKEN